MRKTISTACSSAFFYKDPAQALDKIDDFLPYVDNWATCDMLPPKCLARDTGLLRAP